MNTEIITIIDSSGSMHRLRAETVSGYNKFICEQQAVRGAARATLVTFDNVVTGRYRAVPLGDVRPLALGEYLPAGTTALHDALGLTLEHHGQRIAQEKWAENVIVCVITDGAENASNSYGAAQVKAMTAHAQAHGWHFIYLAANVDAFLTGAAMGISAVHTQSFQATPQGVGQSYANYSAAATSLRVHPAGGRSHG